jgi:hypothetical protein
MSVDKKGVFRRFVAERARHWYKRDVVVSRCEACGLVIGVSKIGLVFSKELRCHCMDPSTRK